ncbi:MAG: carboxypeptidase-like regulatory domain-containing protein [bacterium]
MIATLMRRAAASRAFLAAFGLVVVPAVAAAQATAALTGRVLDSTGAPIVGAGVRIPKLERAANTDSAGRYRFDGLPTGTVTIVGEAPGFTGKRMDVAVPANGTLEQSFSLLPNARVLANVEVRARARQHLPLKLAEFESRRARGMGRFLGPDDVAKYNGKPLQELLKPLLLGARFQRNARGEMIIVSTRSLNPSSLRQSTNIKACQVQIWQDGMLLSDPNSSADLALPTAAGQRGTFSTVHVGSDRDYDVSNLITNDYMAVEYYSDLSSTPPGFRTGSASCGVLVLWTRVPMTQGDQPQGQQ